MKHTVAACVLWALALLASSAVEPILSAQAVEYYWDRCEEFIEDNIIAPAQEHKPGVAMTPDQRDLANAISKYKRVSVESGHGTGKSTTFAWIGMWFTATRHNTTQTLVKVPCIAPTYHQLHDILWPEFERWIPLSRLAPLYDVRREEIFRVGHKKRTFIRGRSPKTAQHVQGFHADHLLWLCDEAFAITDPLVWETIEGSLTQEDNRIIIAGQHTVLVGYVHDAFHRDSEAWQNLRFNSENSPIADQAYNQRVARKYGKNSDIYRVRVLGMEPRGNPDSLISLERAERARHREVKGRGRLEMGVDCARFGDDLTVVTIRHGYHVFPQRIQDKTDTKDIYKLVIRTLRETRRLTGIKSTCDVKVDASGGWGAGVIDLLNDNTTDNIRVIPVNFGGPGNEQYADAASVMWGELEQCIDELDLPDDRDNEFLFDEISTRRYGYDNDMRVKIEPKKDYKTDFESSPDRADSLVLCITKQAPAKRVWPSYVPTRKEHRHKLDIKWDHMEADSCQVFVTMYYDTDTGIYCSFYFWGRKSRKLYVYDEHCDVTPIATRLAAEIRRKAVVPSGEGAAGVWERADVQGPAKPCSAAPRRRRARLPESPV